MAYNETVNVNINANTTDAANEVDKLENSIKTLDGAVNLVGGSIETLAGGLALTGAVTEEQAEKFQTAAVGAIALADGSKRALEGFKTLATETKVVAKAQKLLNMVMRANPLGLVLTAVAALSAAYLLLSSRTDAAAEAAERSREARLKELEALDAIESAELRLARAKGASDEELKRREIESLKRQYEQVTLQRQQLQNEGGISKGVRKNREEIAKTGTEQVRIRKEIAAAEIELENIIKQNAEDEKQRQEDEAKRREEERKANTNYNEEVISLKKKEISFEVDYQNELLKSVDVQAQTELQKTRVLEAQAEQRKKIADAEEAYKQALLTEGIDNIQGALSALFGENKAVASANVLIDAAQAGVAIIKNSQTTGPAAIAYQATQFALLGATTIAALRDINSAEPGSSGTPNVPGGGGSIPRPQTSGVPQIPGFGTSGVQSLNAVVLSGDVTNAQAQDAAIRNRRRFGRGG